MPLALILSSYVAASRIGGAAQQYALAPFKIDPVLVPTVLFGANPAKGGRGRAVDAELFAQLLHGVESQGLTGLVDLVITGHFSLPEQVDLACEAIGRIRTRDRTGAYNRQPIVIVDPILGDAPKGLYVKPEVAAALAERLLPMADWITPNVWELGHLTGREVADAAEAAEAVRALGKPALVTSVPAGPEEIGLLCCAPDVTVLFAHPRRAEAPNGTGDLVTAVFGAGLVEGLAPVDAAERAARAVAETLEAVAEWRAPDLPLVALGERLVRPTARLRIERLA
jgi:pyridoxine kinase